MNSHTIRNLRNKFTEITGLDKEYTCTLYTGHIHGSNFNTSLSFSRTKEDVICSIISLIDPSLLPTSLCPKIELDDSLPEQLNLLDKSKLRRIASSFCLTKHEANPDPIPINTTKPILINNIILRLTNSPLFNEKKIFFPMTLLGNSKLII